MVPSAELQALVARSLDAPPALFPVLPELLADLEDLGARAEQVVTLLRQCALPPQARVLDLGCGKGASSLAIAREWRAHVLGIDAMPAFIAHATERARREALSDRCTFVVGDVREAVRHAEDYDLVLLLALGDLLGGLPETTHVLTHCVRPGGYILLDDAYLAEAVADAGDAETAEGAEPFAGCHDRETTVALIELAGARVIGELSSDDEASHAWLASMTDQVLARAVELSRTRPDLAPHLLDFAHRQREETQALLGPLVGVTWLLQRI